jgi:hypothetical protein
VGQEYNSNGPDDGIEENSSSNGFNAKDDGKMNVMINVCVDPLKLTNVSEGRI